MRIIVLKYLKSLKCRLERECMGSSKMKELINHINIVIRFLKIL